MGLVKFGCGSSCSVLGDLRVIGRENHKLSKFQFWTTPREPQRQLVRTWQKVGFPITKRNYQKPKKKRKFHTLSKIQLKFNLPVLWFIKLHNSTKSYLKAIQYLIFSYKTIFLWNQQDFFFAAKKVTNLIYIYKVQKVQYFFHIDGKNCRFHAKWWQDIFFSILFHFTFLLEFLAFK